MQVSHRKQERGKLVMSNYVERCLCGYWLTQQEIDRGCCPECGTRTSTLDDQWQQWEEESIKRCQQKKRKNEQS